MKISLKNLLLCAVAAVGLSAAGNASAVSILQFGGSVLLQPGTPGTAKSLSSFRGTDGELNSLSVINGSTGIFAPPALTVGTDFGVNSPFIIDPLASSPEPFFFTLAGYTFTLDDATVTKNQGGTGVSQFLNIFGMGMITGPGGFSEEAYFSMSASGAAQGGRISLQGNLSVEDKVPDVPEGGSAVLFLGLGMIGVETLRRKLSKS